MKKTFISLLLVMTIVSGFTVQAFADESKVTVTYSTEYISLPDGGYIIIELAGEPNEISRDRALSSYQIERTKTVSHYNSDDELIWQYTLRGWFTVDYGVSVVCTNADYSTLSNSSSWTFSDCSASAAGNTAYGVGTAKYKIWFITFDTVEIDISISCDIYGNIT